ncbi:MAG: trypsin-like serine protease [Gaiellales bacterium]
MEGLSTDVAGFGVTVAGSRDSSPVLRTVQVPIVGNDLCQAFYPFDPTTLHYARTSMLCAGSAGRDSCSGDSGGPLTAMFGGVRTLIGDVSWGRGCGTAPGVYGRISAFRPWLATALANPRITGVTNAGATVTVAWAHDDPSAAWEPVTYAFVQGGKTTALDGGSTTTSFAVASAAPVSVQVQATSGAETTTASWSGTPSAARAPVVAATITGKAQVGAELRAVPTADDPWATLTYRWLVDGTVVPTATSATYRPTREDMGKAITVSVAATHDTFVGSATATTARIAGLPRPSTRTVAVRGTVAVGGRVWVRAPLASGYPKPRVRYQWLRNRRPLPRTTRASYVITPADAGRRLACRITYTTHAGSTVIVSRTIRVP